LRELREVGSILGQVGTFPVPVRLSVPNLLYVAGTTSFLREGNSPSLTANVEGGVEVVWAPLELEVEASWAPLGLEEGASRVPQKEEGPGTSSTPLIP